MNVTNQKLLNAVISQNTDFGYKRPIVSHLDSCLKVKCWKKVATLLSKNELDMLEVELGQLFWTDVLDLVMQIIALSMSARNNGWINGSVQQIL